MNMTSLKIYTFGNRTFHNPCASHITEVCSINSYRVEACVNSIIMEAGHITMPNPRLPQGAIIL
jgi:hypothetical protein